MQRPASFRNIPSSEDNSQTLLTQTPAILAGVVLTLLVGLPLALYGLRQVIDVIGHLVWFLVAAYVVALTIQFWVAKTWQNGLTSKEIMLAVLWPVDVVRSIRHGVRAAKNQVPGTAGHRAADDQGPKVLTEPAALFAGIIASCLALPLLFVGIGTALNVVGSLVWLLVVVWILGAIVQFWVAESWRDGLTVKELTMAAIWPVDMFKVIREGVNRYTAPSRQS